MLGPLVHLGPEVASLLAQVLVLGRECSQLSSLRSQVSELREGVSIPCSVSMQPLVLAGDFGDLCLLPDDLLLAILAIGHHFGEISLERLILGALSGHAIDLCRGRMP